jgi:hypothetical protein
MMNYYMDRQKNLNESQRQTLIDWLVDVHRACVLQPEVLFLAVRLLDMFLSKHETPKTHVQHVGIACLFVAAKFEEVQAPSIKDFLILQMTSARSLNSSPSRSSFLRLFPSTSTRRPHFTLPAVTPKPARPIVPCTLLLST